MASASQQFLGRPSVLWSLELPDHEPITCLAGEAESGAFLIVIVCHPAEPTSRTFDDVAEAIRWAIEQQAELVVQGWRKIL